MQNVKVKVVVKYGGHNISQNGSINLTLKAQYGEITKSIQLLQMLNNDITVKAKVPECKPKNLGVFRLKEVKFDHDGESIIKLNGLKDYIEPDELNNLPLNDSDVKEFVVLFETEIEEEED